MRKFKKYLTLMHISFKNGTAYRIDYFAGIFNIAFAIIINVILWQSLYKQQNMENSTQHKMMVTYLVFSIIFQTIFIMDEFIIESKISDGTIIHSLLKPMSFRLYIFFSNFGRAVFSLVMLFIPSVIIVVLVFKILPPSSFVNLIFYIVSVTLGYLLLYSFNFIFWTFAFEYMICFGIVMFKNAFITILSGAIIPLWFMPDNIANILSYLPFQSVYYFPLSIYLGIIPQEDIVWGIMTQIFWIALFTIVGHFAWKRAIKEVVVQGG